MTIVTTPSAESVSVTSQHTVRCASETSWKELNSPFHLGPLDILVAPFIPIAVVFVYQRPTSTSSPDAEFIPVERLQRALTLLLDYYPHLTGRLHLNSTDGTREITRLGTGAELFVAQCRKRLDEFSSSAPGIVSPSYILMPNLPAAGNALLAPFDPTDVCNGPIFTVQHTRFACGSVALGVRILHTVCDADGFFQLVRDLAELYRGIQSSDISRHPTLTIPSLAHAPHIRSYMAELIDGDITPVERRAALDFKPSLFYIEPTVDVASAVVSDETSSASSLLPPPVVGRFLRFSSLELKALKALATNPNEPPSDAWISTFDALSAHLYHHVHRARLKLRAKDPTQPTLSPPDFLTPVNIRTRLDLPPRYFPEALLTVYTTLPLDILADGPLWQLAKAVHELTRTTSTTSKDDMNGTIKWIALQPEKQKIRQGFRYGTGSFMVSQWNKVDMYVGTTFDVRPVMVSTPFTSISLMDGLVYFLPTEEQGTSGEDSEAIDVNMALSEPIWDILDQDEEFRRFRIT